MPWMGLANYRLPSKVNEWSCLIGETPVSAFSAFILELTTLKRTTFEEKYLLVLFLEGTKFSGVLTVKLRKRAEVCKCSLNFYVLLYGISLSPLSVPPNPKTSIFFMQIMNLWFFARKEGSQLGHTVEGGM